jgi:hypothetical protein
MRNVMKYGTKDGKESFYKKNKDKSKIILI